jgi:predicted TPR repeat methyltransferase
MTSFDDDQQSDLGPLPPAVRKLLQDGMAAHFTDRESAESLFCQAVTLAPETPAAHRCLVKHYNRCRQFDKALAAAKDWVSAAARQAALPDDWQQWQQAPGTALSALKGLAFIHLRNGQSATAETAIARVLALDPEDGVGGSVIAALVAEMQLAA